AQSDEKYGVLFLSDCSYCLMQSSFFTTSPLNGVLLPTPRSQVTIFNKHEKLFFEIVPCDSELNGRLTTSW
ncbi:TPA: hypothetical protein ACOBHK_002254, partial [Enterococcus faecium]|uniref:hypothetical protein n=4 Tax=Enterococcus faecium TaxID=1352 RepID=UPI00003DA6D5